MNTDSGFTEIHLRDYVYVLRKRKRIVLVTLCVATVFSILYSFFESVVYKSTATILVERDNPNVVEFKEVMALDASSTEYYQTQYQMIKSVTLLSKLTQQKSLSADSYVLSLKGGRFRILLRTLGLARFPWLAQFLTEPQVEDLFIRHMLDVEPIRNSRLVKVGVIHPDPGRASELANALVQLFIQRNLEDRYLVSQRASELIRGQLAEMKEKVSLAEKKLQKYKEEKGLVNIPSVRKSDAFIQEAKLQLVKIQAVEAKLSKRYLPKHPKMIHLRSQIEGLQGKIDEEESKLLEMSGLAIEYSELEREAESAKKIYEALLTRLEETGSEARSQASNILLVDSARIPERPFRPRPFFNLLIGLLLGGLGGICLAFFVDYFDASIKIPDDIEKGLGLELYGIIPVAEFGKKDPSGYSIFHTDNHSAAAESVRALRTALLFKLRQVSGGRVILITSPNPEEGKSTIALNLAAAFAQNHMDVLLVDADLRKPHLHKLLQTDNGIGLSDILEQRVQTSQAIKQRPFNSEFNFLGAGTILDHPTELIGMEQAGRLFAELRGQYDVIVLDASPFLAVADVSVLSEYADMVVFIARYHKTDKRHLKDVRRLFSEARIKSFGVVLNQVSPREKNHYYHRYYYYGYGEQKPAR
ncbi:MAG: polysaccharide biosynthesis tyrosine autokinase [Candidatus Omnitrophica bacterium]|nr:polysaccharide biosynthesis tyrosine autokinase [Candidatus Omnitrophota bacterium]